MNNLRWTLWIAFLLFAAVPILGQTRTANAPPPETTGFIIGIEDVLDITTRNEEELSRQVTVRPDGMITMPLVNDLYVVGLTPDQVRNRITEALKDYVRDPHVTVIIEEFNSFRVYFLGEIVTAGPINFHRPTRLLQAISTAGGLNEFSKKEVVIIREEGNVQKRIEINLKKLLQGEDIQNNIYIKPGDTLVVK